MLRRLSRFLVLLAALQLLGGPWLALQSAAWIGMLAKYSRSDKLVTAFEKTFDGQHPCDLCKVIRSGRAQEQKHQAVAALHKIEAVLASSLSAPVPGLRDVAYGLYAPAGETRSGTPATPPPRAA